MWTIISSQNLTNILSKPSMHILSANVCCSFTHYGWQWEFQQYQKIVRRRYSGSKKFHKIERAGELLGPRPSSWTVMNQGPLQPQVKPWDRRVKGEIEAQTNFWHIPAPVLWPAAGCFHSTAVQVFHIPCANSANWHHWMDLPHPLFASESIVSVVEWWRHVTTCADHLMNVLCCSGLPLLQSQWRCLP